MLFSTSAAGMKVCIWYSTLVKDVLYIGVYENLEARGHMKT